MVCFAPSHRPPILLAQNGPQSPPDEAVEFAEQAWSGVLEVAKPPPQQRVEVGHEVDEYRAFSMRRVEALNYAIKGLPQDRIRFHLCWGSWHGPHTLDIPMRDIVDVLLAINSQAYSFEAGNVRHEHE